MSEGQTPKRLAHATDEVREHYAELAATYDDKANQACKRAYLDLVQWHLGSAKRILEWGAGSSPLLDASNAPLKVAADLSHAMLGLRRTAEGAPRVTADAQCAPFESASFDAIYCINVLEHAPDPSRVTHEVARLLAPGGRFLAVTPNGDLEWLLDLLERLHLKLPEGPHSFLSTAKLAELAGTDLTIVEHRCFLAFPAGPAPLVGLIDRMIAGDKGRGLFQYILLEKNERFRRLC